MARKIFKQTTNSRHWQRVLNSNILYNFIFMHLILSALNEEKLEILTIVKVEIMRVKWCGLSTGFH